MQRSGPFSCVLSDCLSFLLIELIIISMMNGSSVIVVSHELNYLVKAHLGQNMFCSDSALKSTWNQIGPFFIFLMHVPALIVNDSVLHIIPNENVFIIFNQNKMMFSFSKMTFPWTPRRPCNLSRLSIYKLLCFF